MSLSKDRLSLHMMFRYLHSWYGKTFNKLMPCYTKIRHQWKHNFQNQTPLFLNGMQNVKTKSNLKYQFKVLIVHNVHWKPKAVFYGCLPLIEIRYVAIVFNWKNNWYYLSRLNPISVFYTGRNIIYRQKREGFSDTYTSNVIKD